MYYCDCTSEINVVVRSMYTKGNENGVFLLVRGCNKTLFMIHKTQIKYTAARSGAAYKISTALVCTISCNHYSFLFGVGMPAKRTFCWRHQQDWTRENF